MCRLSLILYCATFIRVAVTALFGPKLFRLCLFIVFFAQPRSALCPSLPSLLSYLRRDDGNTISALICPPLESACLSAIIHSIALGLLTESYLLSVKG